MVEEGFIGGFVFYVLYFLVIDGLFDGGLKVRLMVFFDCLIDYGLYVF